MHITKLGQVLAQWEKNGGDLANELDGLGNYSIEQHKDAKAICRTLVHPRMSEPKGKDIITSPLYAIVALFQDITSREAFEELCTNGLPHLRRFLEQGLEHASHDNDDLLFILKTLAMYGQKEDIDLIIKAARKPLMPDDYGWWSAIFKQVDHEHVGHQSLCDGLREPLPKGFIAMIYLDFANSLAINGHLDKHPFDSEQGYARLEHWLTDPFCLKTYAHNATAALPFIQEHKRQRFLQIVAEHLDVEPKEQSGDRVLMLKHSDWKKEAKGTIRGKGVVRRIYDGTVHFDYYIEFDEPQTDKTDEANGMEIEYSGSTVLEEELCPLVE
ncbi:MAG: hypothetical protein DRR16_27495 [Candidatus Parabeggiatoa sp. nov. 3]|nr:MAG: hypothetical protein DRR00_14250 [Gammaproteobacteria bacterium]RKZ52857.1 MAG: hypothetical protein DRQ99_32185 [Gammaproteobacteria bacterium]RKZ78550.1 MAG: hypothetical protein DRR16_27495 [Gammaproteobacteria bacterium]